jgi:DNA (cytosine-5)-methyltransferase 3A
MKELNVTSLFDGISCGMAAFERANIPVKNYTAYEIESSAIEVSRFNYPTIEQKGDVFKAKYTEGESDIVIGGSPCTFWSIARCPQAAEGKRETTISGIGGDLSLQYHRAIKEIKPRWFLYENNASMTEAIKNEISNRLNVEPILIDSADFSAQNRQRLYWTNIPVDLDYIKSELVFADIEYLTDVPKEYVKTFKKYESTMRDNGVVVSWDTSGKGNYSQQNRARRTNVKMNTLPSSGNDKNNIYLGGTYYRKIHPIEAERLQTLPDNYTACIKSDIKRTELCGNGWTVDVIAHILRGICQ